MTNISQSSTYKMAAKINWHRYGTKLRHCHPMYMSTARSGFISPLSSSCRPLGTRSSSALVDELASAAASETPVASASLP